MKKSDRILEKQDRENGLIKEIREEKQLGKRNNKRQKKKKKKKKERERDYLRNKIGKRRHFEETQYMKTGL